MKKQVNNSQPLHKYVLFCNSFCMLMERLPYRAGEKTTSVTWSQAFKLLHTLLHSVSHAALLANP